MLLISFSRFLLIRLRRSCSYFDFWSRKEHGSYCEVQQASYTDDSSARGGFPAAQQRLTTLMFSLSPPHDGSREDFSPFKCKWGYGLNPQRDGIEERVSGSLWGLTGLFRRWAQSVSRRRRAEHLKQRAGAGVKRPGWGTSEQKEEENGRRTSEADSMFVFWHYKTASHKAIMVLVR